MKEHQLKHHITRAHQKFCTAKDEYYKSLIAIHALLQDKSIQNSYQNLMLSLENLSRAIVTQKEIGNHDYRHAERYSRYVSNNLYEHTRNILFVAKELGARPGKGDIYDYEAAKMNLVISRRELEDALRRWNEFNGLEEQDNQSMKETV